VAAIFRATDARGVYDAGGKIVSAGLIDVHGHVYDGGTRPRSKPTSSDRQRHHDGSSMPDRRARPILPDCESTIIERAHHPCLPLLNIGMNGCCNNEIYGDPRFGRRASGDRHDSRPIVHTFSGSKFGSTESTTISRTTSSVLRGARGGRRHQHRLMMHWTNEPDLIALLKPGDILTHPYNPPSPNSRT
jgi:predicted amidohydrolase